MRMLTKENKERLQKATAKKVFDYIETREGQQGASPAKIAEFKETSRVELGLPPEVAEVKYEAE